MSTRRPCAAGTGAGGAEEVQRVVEGRVGEGRGVRGVRARRGGRAVRAGGGGEGRGADVEMEAAGA